MLAIFISKQYLAAMRLSTHQLDTARSERGALARLEREGLIEPVATEDRRRPYRLTTHGAEALHTQLAEQRKVADIGLRRLQLGVRLP
jgi:hypothetical protein